MNLRDMLLIGLVLAVIVEGLAIMGIYQNLTGLPGGWAGLDVEAQLRYRLDSGNSLYLYGSKNGGPGGVGNQGSGVFVKNRDGTYFDSYLTANDANNYARAYLKIRGDGKAQVYCYDEAGLLRSYWSVDDAGNIVLYSMHNDGTTVRAYMWLAASGDAYIICNDAEGSSGASIHLSASDKKVYIDAENGLYVNGNRIDL